MAIECSRNLMKLNQVVGEESSQALVEGEINVPDSREPVVRILDISCDAIINSHEVIQDKIMVEGILRYDALYIPEGEDAAVDAVDAEIGFTQYLEMPGVQPGMTSRLQLDVEHIDYELVSGRRINVKAVLNLYGRVSQVMELEAVQDFTGLTDVEALTDHIRTSVSGEAGNAQTMVREDLELSDSMPSILKILRKEARVQIQEKKAVDNKVVVHGDVDLNLLYLCDDEEDPVQFLEQSIPFSHSVDIPGAYQGMDCTAEVTVSEFYTDPRENINNELRIVDAELILNLEVQVFETQEDEILIDAYSPSVPMELKKRKIKLQQFAGETQEQTVVKESITFPEGVPKARKILYVDATPSIAEERAGDGKVLLEGILSVQVVYQTNESALLIGSFREDVPFQHTLTMEDIDSGMECRSEAVTEHTDATLLAQDEVELKAAVLLKTSVTRTIEKEIIIGAEESENLSAGAPGIYIYFVQPGDNLWNVAKKYNTTISDILKYNETAEEESELVPGTKLMIFKKLESSVV